MTIQANQGFGVSVFGAVSGGGGGSTSPGGSSGQVQYNNGGAFGGMSGTTWSDANQSLAIASTGTGTGVTTSQPVLNLSQTWNDGAGGTVTFTGLKFNATDTASASGSLLLDIGTGGGSYSSKFSVTKAGLVDASSQIYMNANFVARSGTLNFPSNMTGFIGGYDGSADRAFFYSGVIASGLATTRKVMFFDSSTVKFDNGTSAGAAVAIQLGADATATTLYRPASGTGILQLGAADAAAPVAQTLQVQSGSGTDINGVAFNIGGSKSTGTGTAGLVNIQTSSRGAASGTSQNVLATVASFGPNTLSGSQAISLLNMAQTWNTSGAPTAIQLNVTDTASNGQSLLFDLQVGGTSQFKVRKDGAVFLKSSETVLSFGNSFMGGITNGFSFYDGSVSYSSFLTIPASSTFQFGKADAAAPAAQTLQVQSGSGTDKNGADWSIIGSLNTGAGTPGKIIFKTGIVGSSGTIKAAATSAWGIDGNQTLYPAASQSTSMTKGFINIPGGAGAPSGTPDNTTGFPLYWDSTNLKLYVYTGGAWKSSAAFT